MSIGFWLVLAFAAPPRDLGPRQNDPDPHHGAHTWLQPAPHIQAERDTSRPTAATGAIFVPAMTDPRFEPAYVVTRDGETIAERRMGSKLWVPPGTYRVLIGSGDIGEKLEFEVVVVQQRTTFVPVEWSGIRITVVNERGTPFRGSYELVRLPKREYVGIGLGADLAQGETLTSWLVEPGKYMVLSAGESYRARKNFATIRVLPGELVRYTLVLDETTGDVLGAGEVDEETSPSPEATGPWNVSVLLGGSLSFNKSDDVVGKPEGMSFDVSAFFETIGGYDALSHLFYARLYIEEQGRLTLPEAFYLNLVDTFDVDILYMYRVVSWFGPYVRSSLATSLVPSYQDFTSPTDVRKLGTDGQTVGFEADTSDVQLTEPFAPIDLRYGAGGRFEFSPTYWFDLKARLGVGARHVFARDLFVLADDQGTPDFEIRQVPDFNQFGVESSLLTELRITRWVLFKAEADVLIPFDAPSETVLDIEATVALRLASFASLNYVVRLELDRAITTEVQLDQSVLLRFAYKFL